MNHPVLFLILPCRTIKGGIQVEDVSMGNGPEAKRGKMVGIKDYRVESTG